MYVVCVCAHVCVRAGAREQICACLHTAPHPTHPSPAQQATAPTQPDTYLVRDVDVVQDPDHLVAVAQVEQRLVCRRGPRRVCLRVCFSGVAVWVGEGNKDERVSPLGLQLAETCTYTQLTTSNPGDPPVMMKARCLPRRSRSATSRQPPLKYTCRRKLGQFH